MHVIFKPFTTFEDLYNGIGWEKSYSDILTTTNYNQYIENIQEIHVGIEEKHENSESNDEAVDEIEDDECDNDDDTSDNTVDQVIDSQTVEPLDVTKNTQWVEESTSNH